MLIRWPATVVVPMSLVAAAVVTAPAAAAAPRGAVLPSEVAGGPLVAGTNAPVVADGRIWQMSGYLRGTGASWTLRSWPLRGHGTPTVLKVPSLPGRGQGDGPPDLRQLSDLGRFAVDGDALYVTARICRQELPRACDDADQTFVLDRATGAVRRTYPIGEGPGVNALQPGVVLSRGTIDDQGRPVATYEAPGAEAPYPYRKRPASWALALAGRYVLERLNDGTAKRRYHDMAWAVTDFTTGRRLYRVSAGQLLRRAGVPRAAISANGPAVKPDGSLRVEIERAESRTFRDPDTTLRRGAFPVYVTLRGQIRRAGPRLRGATRVTADPAGPRVFVTSGSANYGRVERGDRIVCKGAWIASADGRRGYALATEPRAGSLRVGGSPVYWDGRTAIVPRFVNGNGNHRRLIVRQLDGTTLRQAQRPRCKTASTSYRLTRDQPY